MAYSSNTNKIIIGAQKYNDIDILGVVNKIKVTLKKKLIPVVKPRQPKPQKQATKKQKETPPLTCSLRKFYTSLLQQRPSSKMAFNWCLERNLCDENGNIFEIDKLKLKIKLK